MDKIVLDTNVIVSALLTEGYPARILSNLVLARNVLFCLSDEVWQEYIHVLHRPKFAKYPAFTAQAEIVLSQLENVAFMFQPDITLSVIPTDESDNKFVELAVYAEANFLITGNINDFTFTRYERVQIISPQKYWEQYGKFLLNLEQF